MSNVLLLTNSGPYAPASFSLFAQYSNNHDFGLLLNKVIINLSWSETNVFGTGTLRPFISTSIDGITYTPVVQTNSLYVDQVRYVNIFLNYFPADHKSALKISNLRVQVSVHSEGDGGSIEAQSTDVSGTRVTFNKPYRAIDSVTITPISTNTVFSAYTNLGLTGFNVLVWDQAGTRVSRTVTWLARGAV